MTRRVIAVIDGHEFLIPALPSTPMWGARPVGVRSTDSPASSPHRDPHDAELAGP